MLLVNFSLGSLSRHPAPSVLIPALRTVGNIVTGDDVQTQVRFCSVLNLSLYELCI